MKEEGEENKKERPRQRVILSIRSADHPVDGELFENDATRGHNFCFAIILLILQFIFCFLYGFLFRVQPQTINVASIITAIGLAILIVPGTNAVR